MIQKKFEREKLLGQQFATQGKFKFVIILDHLKNSFNIGKIFRSAEVFSASEVHIIGIPFFDPYPAKGSLKKVKAYFYDDFDGCYNELCKQGYSFFVMNPTENSIPLSKVDLPLRSAFVFGHEEFGHSFKKNDYETSEIKIEQFGETESLNVSVAASITMYEYVRRFNL